MGQEKLPVAVELIERRIYIIRGHKVMLDADLAQLYQVPTFRLHEAVKRNRKRFPEDFMFQLTVEENESLKSHFAMSKGRGGRQEHLSPKSPGKGRQILAHGASRGEMMVFDSYQSAEGPSAAGRGAINQIL
jgi:hypothetical protein